ncbi:MAG: hypothetical protein K9J12_08390 [Melioribacteraceae bacterium]|nr:hypothetical protein [Melioribacteraceae bacterium]MCF8264324.1 hypothetical protein [Melioribacteraceae bacterium]MCF8431666.1 hypothetical protein [Melioribacteraceae bacterium]
MNYELFLNEFNKSWIEKDFEKLKSCMHQNVVFLLPDLITEVKGADNCTNSYLEFMKVATINTFSEKEILVNEFKSSVTIKYSFEIDYEIDSVRYKETGHEILVLEKSEYQPKIIWRLLLNK